jgi:fructose-1,6-bisphosphatase/inositol monophosphatase family enzyme
MNLLMVEKPISAISINCDNKMAIVKVNSFKANMKSSRHIKRQLKFVRKLRNSRVITLEYVHTAKNPTDQYIKVLSRNEIDGSLSEMGLRPT